MASVAVVPAQATVAIGSTTQLKAIATFSDGSTKDVTTDFAWTSSDTRTITATSSGLLSGLATGKATITGSYQGQPSLGAGSQQHRRSELERSHRHHRSRHLLWKLAKHG